MRHVRTTAHLVFAVAVTAAASGCGSASSDGSSESSVADLNAGQCAKATAWAPGTPYKVGDVVTFGGQTFVVIQPHTSQSDWAPNIVPALYKQTNCAAQPTPPAPPPSKAPPPGPSPAPAPPPTPPGGVTGTAPASLVFSSYKDTSINMNFNNNVVSTLLTGARTALATELPQAGGKTVTLAFATQECGSEKWGSVPGAAMASANAQLLNQSGVKYILSTGGANGVFSCGSDAGMETFIGRWASPSLIGVDFDIEAGQTQGIINDLVSRIKSAHAAHPGLRFSLTLATAAASRAGSTTAQSLGSAAPDSFNVLGDGVMSAVKGILGFNGSPSSWPSFVTVNLMTMDYGGTGPGNCVVVNGACQMGQSALQAALNLRDRFGVPFSNIEITPMIGGNDTPGETFNLQDVDTVAHFAIANGLAGVHYWSYDRDIDCAPGSAQATCNTFGQAGTHGFLARFLRDGLR
jgi:hypothetical protein